MRLETPAECRRFIRRTVALLDLLAYVPQWIDRNMKLSTLAYYDFHLSYPTKIPRDTRDPGWMEFWERRDKLALELCSTRIAPEDDGTMPPVEGL